MKQTKSIFLIIICSMLLISIVNVSSNNNIPDSSFKPKSSLSGEYVYQGSILYYQALGQVVPYSCIGINSISGQTDLTDVVLSGTSGSGSWRSIQGYYSNTSNSLPFIRSDNVDQVLDMVKFEDPITHDMNVLWGQQGDNTGKLCRFEAVNINRNPDKEIIPDKYWTMGPVISITLGNFTSNSEIQAAVLCSNGKVYGIDDLDVLTSWNCELDEDFYQDDERKFKDLIAPIDNIDAHGEGWQDIIVGNNRNITAISTNNTKSIIWTKDVGSNVGSLIIVPDQNNDGKEDIAVAAYNGLYLLSGKDGAILSTLTGVGTLYRDIELFNETAIVSGNWDSSIYIWDIDTDSPTFGQVLHNITNFGISRIYSILNIGDLNEDGQDEFAFAGDSLVGAMWGNNQSWIWKKQPIGNWLAPSAIRVFDMELIDDRDNDGFNDILLTGSAVNLMDSGMFIMTARGQKVFVPDLSAYGTVDSYCNSTDHNYVFTCTVYQKKGLECSVKLLINESVYTMQKEASNDWASGVDFTYSTTLEQGEYIYKFNITDTSGDSIIENPDNFIESGIECTQDINEGDGPNEEIPGINSLLLVGLIALTSVVLLLSKNKKITLKN